MGEDFPQKFGQYTLHELIGRGGMAEIYRATMPGIGGFEKTVAIKKILPHLAEDDEFTSMLIDEARIIESLDHSNIAQVFDLGKREGTYYIAMEYIHGLDLAEIIDELHDHGEYIPIPHVIHITSSICAGLDFAHSKTDEDGNPLNVIHRDISPHNIRLSFAGEVKIIDFGVAKAADREAHTKMGVIKGKLLYMAPEQAKAEDLDGRADLFATGLCSYKMLTGELPFEGENEFQVYNNILQKDIVPPKHFRPEIPEELNRIVMKLLERDRDERYQEGYEAKQDLDPLLHEVAPGYTVNRLSRWVEDNFSHLVQQETEPDQQTATSNPSDIAPSTPTGQRNPGTGEHGAAELEAQQPDPDQVPEPVPADGGQRNAGSARQPAQSSHLDEDDAPAGHGSHRTQTSSDEATGQFKPDQPQRDSGGVPTVVYAIIAVVLAIAGMVGYALTVKNDAADAGGPAPTDRKAESQQAPSGLIQVQINSDPQEAELVRKGEVVGRTPTKFVLPKGEDPIELTLVKAGFKDKTIDLVPMEDYESTIELTAAPDTGVASGPDAGSDDVDEEADDEPTEEPDETANSEASSDDGESSDDGRESASNDRGGASGSDDSTDSRDEAGAPSDRDESGGSGSSESSDGSDSSDPFDTVDTIGDSEDDSGESQDESSSSSDDEESGGAAESAGDDSTSDAPESGSEEEEDKEEILDPFAE